MIAAWHDQHLLRLGGFFKGYVAEEPALRRTHPYSRDQRSGQQNPAGPIRWHGRPIPAPLRRRKAHSPRWPVLLGFIHILGGVNISDQSKAVAVTIVDMDSFYIFI